MNKFAGGLFIIFMSLALTEIVYSVAPEQHPGIVLNKETGQCAAYSLYYSERELPPGWEKYIEQNGIIETEFGNCTFRGEGDGKACCEKLGFEYVSYSYVTDIMDRIRFWRDIQITGIFAVVFSLLVIVFVGLKLRS